MHVSIVHRHNTRYGKQVVRLWKRGRRSGEKRTLSCEQELDLRKTLIDKTPDQMKLSFALWTRDMEIREIGLRCLLIA